MTCSEFTEMVHELARPAGLDQTTGAIARAHAENCPACAFRLAEAEGLARMFAEVAQKSRRQEAPEWLEKKLVEEFRCEQNARRVVPRRWRRGWRIALEWAAVSAAVALVAVAMLHRVPDRQPAPTVRTHAVSGLGNSAPAASGPRGALSAAAGRASMALPARTPANRLAGVGLGGNQMSEVGGEFVPVPFSGTLAPGDAAVIVRVQLPRSALAELGYPIDETQGEQVVRADLVVGQDGWPHAVRIVH